MNILIYVVFASNRVRCLNVDEIHSDISSPRIMCFVCKATFIVSLFVFIRNRNNIVKSAEEYPLVFITNLNDFALSVAEEVFVFIRNINNIVKNECRGAAICIHEKIKYSCRICSPAICELCQKTYAGKSGLKKHQLICPLLNQNAQ